MSRTNINRGVATTVIGKEIGEQAERVREREREKESWVIAVTISSKCSHGCL